MHANRAARTVGELRGACEARAAQIHKTGAAGRSNLHHGAGHVTRRQIHSGGPALTEARGHDVHRDPVHGPKVQRPRGHCAAIVKIDGYVEVVQPRGERAAGRRHDLAVAGKIVTRGNADSDVTSVACALPDPDRQIRRQFVAVRLHPEAACAAAHGCRQPRDARAADAQRTRNDEVRQAPILRQLNVA